MERVKQSKTCSKGIQKPILVPRHSDNGELSHYDVVDSSDGETLFTNATKDEADTTCKNLRDFYYEYQDHISNEIDKYFNEPPRV